MLRCVTGRRDRQRKSSESAEKKRKRGKRKKEKERKRKSAVSCVMFAASMQLDVSPPSVLNAKFFPTGFAKHFVCIS